MAHIVFKSTSRHLVNRSILMVDKLLVPHRAYVARNQPLLEQESQNAAAKKPSTGKTGLGRVIVPFSAPTPTTRNKVSIIGCGQVGMACAFSLITQHIASSITLVDTDANRLRGEALDLQHGMTFLRKIRVEASTDFAKTAGSKVCIITAGARQEEGESRLALLQRNIDIYREIIPKLCSNSPDSVLLIVSNPVDIMTYAAWKMSGFAKHKVIGSGTTLDTARFKFLISEKAGVASSACRGYILGEHGDTSVPLWSGVQIAGVQLSDVNSKVGHLDDPEQWAPIHKDVVDSAYEIISYKGYTSWGVGLAVSAITRCVLKNLLEVYPVSTLAQGYYGIDKEVFLSLPCALGESGINSIVKPSLAPTEREALVKSAETLYAVQKDLKMYE